MPTALSPNSAAHIGEKPTAIPADGMHSTSPGHAAVGGGGAPATAAGTSSTSTSTGNSNTDGGAAVVTIAPCATEHLPVNVKVLLISDVDDDGENELIVGKTDRIVIAYRWVSSTRQLKRLWYVTLTLTQPQVDHESTTTFDNTTHTLLFSLLLLTRLSPASAAANTENK
jgi:hypothetical protein